MVSATEGPAVFSSRDPSRSDLFKQDFGPSFTRAIAQIRIESNARVDCEGLIEPEMQALTRGRIHLQLIDGATDGIQQMRPSFECLRSDTAPAGLWLTFRPAI